MTAIFVMDTFEFDDDPEQGLGWTKHDPDVIIVIEEIAVTEITQTKQGLEVGGRLVTWHVEKRQELGPRKQANFNTGEICPPE